MEDNFEKVEQRIADELIDLDLPLQGKPFTYWSFLLNYIFWNIKHDNLQKFSLIQLYNVVADEFDTNRFAAERALREGMRKMNKRIVEKYNIRTKITNGTVIKLFQLKVF